MTSNFCPQCGTAIQAGVRFCPNCGQPTQSLSTPAPVPQSPQYVAYAPAQYSDNPPAPGKGMAIASLVLGIASIFLPYIHFLLAIIGLILGITSRGKLSEARQPTGIATAAIVLNIIGLAWFSLVMFGAF